jgi:hypothetical protein
MAARTIPAEFASYSGWHTIQFLTAISISSAELELRKNKKSCLE